MGNNGMTRMNLLGATGKPITEEYKELFGEEAYAEFDKMCIRDSKKDVPGFIANRMQHALWREAISIVENGIVRVPDGFHRREDIAARLELFKAARVNTGSAADALFRVDCKAAVLIL